MEPRLEAKRDSSSSDLERYPDIDNLVAKMRKEITLEMASGLLSNHDLQDDLSDLEVERPVITSSYKKSFQKKQSRYRQLAKANKKKVVPQAAEIKSLLPSFTHKPLTDRIEVQIELENPEEQTIEPKR